MDVNLSNQQVILLILLAIWELVWKGFALWRAASLRQPYWFAAILIVNSFGILPIIYLLATQSKVRHSDMMMV